MLADIQLVVAEQLDLRANDVNPEQTFASVGADDLDLVEITMEVEDRFGIAIALYTCPRRKSLDPNTLPDPSSNSPV